MQSKLMPHILCFLYLRVSPHLNTAFPFGAYLKDFSETHPATIPLPESFCGDSAAPHCSFGYQSEL